MRIFIYALMFTAVISGCVSTSEMTAIVPDNIQKVDTGSPLYKSLSVGVYDKSYSNFYNQQISNEDVSSALELALSQGDFYTQLNPTYVIWPSVIHLKQPAMGLDMEVTAQINYIVKDDAGKIIFDRTISTSYTADISEAFIGVTRVRLANEGAVRANITEFITQFTAWHSSQ